MKKNSLLLQHIKNISFLPGRIFDRIKNKTLDDIDNYEIEFAIVAIVKNEGDYIQEWIRYHKIVGIEKFIIYDNNSTDDTAKILKRYVEAGDVIYNFYPGFGRQMEAYNDAIAKYKDKIHYMAFIDADEFIYPIERDKKISEIISEIIQLDKHSAGVALNWRVFGSSNFINKPQSGGVIDNYLYRSFENGKGNECIKTVAIPKYIYRYNHPHYPIYKLGYYAIDEKGNKVTMWKNEIEEISKIRINHYFTKSKEEWIKRRSMGRGAAKNNPEKFKRSIDEFYEHDHNDVYDDGMLYFVELLKNGDS